VCVRICIDRLNNTRIHIKRDRDREREREDRQTSERLSKIYQHPFTNGQQIEYSKYLFVEEV
jgi:hypothetical protein